MQYYGLAVASSPEDVSIRCDFATFLWFQAADAPSSDKAFQEALATEPDDVHLLQQWIRCATDPAFVEALERSSTTPRRDVAIELADSARDAQRRLKNIE